jgi:hypothetical protein
MKLTDAVAVLAALGLAGCQPAPVVAVPDGSDQAGVQTATTSGVSFDHATGVETRPCEGDMPRCIVLFDPAAEEFMRDLLTIQVFDGTLETVAAEEAGFERDAAGRLMTTYGRFEPVAVEAFGEPGRQGLRAVVTGGISDSETGFHAAAGECLWAAISDGGRTAVLSSNGLPAGLEAAERAVATLRFAPAPE